MFGNWHNDWKVRFPYHFLIDLPYKGQHFKLFFRRKKGFRMLGAILDTSVKQNDAKPSVSPTLSLKVWIQEEEGGEGWETGRVGVEKQRRNVLLSMCTVLVIIILTLSSAHEQELNTRGIIVHWTSTGSRTRRPRFESQLWHFNNFCFSFLSCQMGTILGETYMS